MKVQNSLTMKGTDLRLKEQVYLDFLAKSKFVGLYVPLDVNDISENGKRRLPYAKHLLARWSLH